MTLLMESIRWYVPESWKTFTAYATTSTTELFRRYFTEVWTKIIWNATANHQRNYFVFIFIDDIIPLVYSSR
jgi:hypothetical protein